MKNKIFNKLLYVKLMLLVVPCYKRQKYIDELKSAIREYLLEFDIESVSELIEQVDCLNDDEKNQLFSEEFPLYDFLKFGKIRLEIDEYNPEDCRTYLQFNDVLRIYFILIDFKENLNESVEYANN